MWKNSPVQEEVVPQYSTAKRRKQWRSSIVKIELRHFVRNNLFSWLKGESESKSKNKSKSKSRSKDTNTNTNEANCEFHDTKTIKKTKTVIGWEKIFGEIMLVCNSSNEQKTKETKLKRKRLYFSSTILAEPIGSEEDASLLSSDKPTPRKRQQLNKTSKISDLIEETPTGTPRHMTKTPKYKIKEVSTNINEEENRNPDDKSIAVLARFVELFEDELFRVYGKRSGDYLHQLRCFLHFTTSYDESVTSNITTTTMTDNETLSLFDHKNWTGFAFLIINNQHSLRKLTEVIANFDWDAHTLQSLSSRRATEMNTTTSKENDNEDETLKPMSEILKQLDLDKEVKLIQCRKCRSWKVTFYIKQTRGSDEPLTTKCRCLDCERRWTQPS